jgi:hypothetical protein
MSDAKAVYQKADAQRIESDSHTATDALGRAHDVDGRVVVEVGEVVDVLFRDHEAFAWRRGSDRHEGHYNIILADNARRALSTNYLTEDAGLHEH